MARSRSRLNSELRDSTVARSWTRSRSRSYAPLLTVELTPRSNVAPGTYDAHVEYAAARDRLLAAMGVELGAAVVLVLGVDSLADANIDGTVDSSDLEILAAAYGSVRGDTAFDLRADLNLDGIIDLRDLAILGIGYE